LKIRRFVKGKDEADMVKLHNAVFYRHPTVVLVTVEDYKKYEKDPSWDSEGAFIVEVDNNPIGWVHGYVDKFREDKQGVAIVRIMPEFSNRGLEDELAEIAIGELKRRGVKVAQSLVEGVAQEKMLESEDARLWEKRGFRLERIGSIMSKRLDDARVDIGENKEVTLESLRKDSDEDLKLLNRLINESFKEHWNWRPVPLESTVYSVRKDFSWNPQGWFFALLDGQPVGFIGALMGVPDNRPENAKRGWVLPRGWIWSIGVLKPYRGTGIGTRLLLHGMDFLKVKGVAEVMIQVDDSNVTKPKQLYEKVGFTEFWKQSIYEKRIA
jgi:ribosomal protein S18 acetylase RimI-like enzyme